jgi:hypothetical protein
VERDPRHAPRVVRDELQVLVESGTARRAWIKVGLRARVR